MIELAIPAAVLAFTALKARPFKLPLYPDGTARSAAVVKVAAAAAPIAAKANMGQLFPLAVAQAMLETGWGRAVPGGNWYGIKGRGPAGAVNVKTREEFSPGVISHIRDNFRAYDSLGQSVQDWLHFVTNGRYTQARQMSAASAALWIWANGYATATGYVPALVNFSRHAAKAVQQPQLEITLTAAQKSLASQLAAYPAKNRPALARGLWNSGRWPA